MTAGPGATGGLLVPGTSRIHRLAPETKLAATVLFAFAVVATPGAAFWAFGVHLAVVLAVVVAAGLPIPTVLRRLRIEVPFLAFAVFLPLVGSSPRVEVLGVALSEAGLWGAWNIVAKGTLGVLASIVLAATTPVVDVLRGLERLHLPKVLTGITAFMVRYLDVIVGEASRMHVARQSRGYDPRWLGQAKGVAASGGTLFIRSYERGERVHLAMLARGWTGAMPVLVEAPAGRREWVAGLVPVAAALVIAVAARWWT